MKAIFSLSKRCKSCPIFHIVCSLLHTWQSLIVTHFLCSYDNLLEQLILMMAKSVIPLEIMTELELSEKISIDQNNSK